MGFHSCECAIGAIRKKTTTANFVRKDMKSEFNSNRAERCEQSTVELASQNTRARRSSCRAGP
jgi:hypothetical protein